jgi:subtilisin family serine protease
LASKPASSQLAKAKLECRKSQTDWGGGDVKIRGISRLATACMSVASVIAAALVPVALSPASAGAAISSSAAETSTLTSADRSVIISVDKTQFDALVAFVSTLRLTTEFQYRFALHGIALTASPGQIAVIRDAFPSAIVQNDVEYRIETTQTNAPWNLSLLDQSTFSADTSYEYPTTAGEGIKAYVVDTGVAANQTQFGSRLLAGADFTGSGSTGDCNGHGTHVAGTIGSRDYGVAKKVTIVPLRALGGQSGSTCLETGTTANVIAAINWAIADNPAGKRAVLNMSLGSQSPSGRDALLDQAITNALSDGIVVVVAAGNSAATKQANGNIVGDACQYSPANSPGTITVGAVDASGVEASFSNYGQCVDIMAPGVNVRSLYAPNAAGSAVMSGTSMASPHVAGAVALYIAEHPTDTVATIQSSVLASGRADAVTLHPGGSEVYDTSTPYPQRVYGMSTPTHVGTNTTRIMLNISSLVSVPTNSAIPVVSISRNAGADGAPRFVPSGTSTTLTTTAGTWNGAAAGTTTYAWYRCSSATAPSAAVPAGCQVIPTATSATYTVTIDDVGSFLSSAVSVSNNQGSVTQWSSASAAVNESPSNTVPPRVIATDTNPDTVVSASDGTWRGTPSNEYTHQWYSCTAEVLNASTTRPAGCTAIDNATQSSFQLVGAFAGRYIVVETRAQNAATGNATISHFSASTTAVRGAPSFVSLTGLLTVSNQGANLAPQFLVSSGMTSRLSVTPGTWTGYPSPTYTYLWFRCASRTSISSILPDGCISTGSTGNTYAVTQADIGSYMAPAVTATNELGTATKYLAATAIVGQSPQVTVRPAVTATSPRVGRATAMTAGSWIGSPTPSITVQWYVCSGTVRATIYRLPAGCTRVTGAQRSKLTPQPWMVGRYLLVSVTARNPVAPAAGIMTFSKSTAVVRY